MTQTAGLALANDLAPAKVRPRVVSLLYVMLLVGMLLSSLVLGRSLVDFTPDSVLSRSSRARRWSPWCST